jgi:hypothetical protein
MGMIFAFGLDDGKGVAGRLKHVETFGQGVVLHADAENHTRNGSQVFSRIVVPVRVFPQLLHTLNVVIHIVNAGFDLAFNRHRLVAVFHKSVDFGYKVIFPVRDFGVLVGFFKYKAQFLEFFHQIRRDHVLDRFAETFGEVPDSLIGLFHLLASLFDQPVGLFHRLPVFHEGGPNLLKGQALAYSFRSCHG